MISQKLVPSDILNSYDLKEAQVAMISQKPVLYDILNSYYL